MAKIKVFAGDLEHGAWSIIGGTTIFKTTKSHPWKGEKVDIKAEAGSVEQLSEEGVKKLAGTAGWGIAGAVLLGPLGAIGGMLVGGNKKEVAFVCHLHDGRKFMATTDGKSWQKIVAAHF